MIFGAAKAAKGDCFAIFFRLLETFLRFALDFSEKCGILLLINLNERLESGSGLLFLERVHTKLICGFLSKFCSIQGKNPPGILAYFKDF